ncbi:MAG: hemolysin III family protein [Syntrophales bacterium]|nr:hemolysin III family protein [Syntrophales bacterium]
MWNWTLFGLIRGFAVVGVFYELLFLGRYQWITLTIYLGDGLARRHPVKPMLTIVPRGLVWWLLAGGLCYTGGVLFSVREKMRYHHVVWHLFVLFGSACHFPGFLFCLV